MPDFSKVFGISTAGIIHTGPNKPIAVPLRVEPKVYFANERTFLSWTYTSILIAGLSLTILGKYLIIMIIINNIKIKELKKNM